MQELKARFVGKRGNGKLSWEVCGVYIDAKDGAEAIQKYLRRK